jgi:hypothetical protein
MQILAPANSLRLPQPLRSHPYIPIGMLVLLALCTTRRGGLELLSRPNTRLTPFRALADEDKWFEEASKRRAQNEAPWIWDWFDEDEQLWSQWLRGNDIGSRPRCMLALPVDYGFLVTLRSALTPGPRSCMLQRRIQKVNPR